VWLALSDSQSADAWLSIVTHKDKPGYLLVRARNPDHITDNFPDEEMYVIPSADYPYRANIRSEVVGDFMRDYCMAMDYSNFKNSLKDNDFAHAMTDVWTMVWNYGRKYRPEESE